MNCVGYRPLSGCFPGLKLSNLHNKTIVWKLEELCIVLGEGHPGFAEASFWLDST
jgi:hypothetical protein